MAAIEKATAAVGSCSAGNVDESVLSWDMAAALFYGADGEIVYAMGQKRCENFGTCGADGEAAVNTAIFSNLNDGQAALQSGVLTSPAWVPTEKNRSLRRVPLT